MPDALKIFIWSLIAALVSATLTAKLGNWIVERFFPREPLALALLMVSIALISVASAVTAGVLMGRNKRP